MARRVGAWTIIVVLAGVVLFFAVARFVIDIPFITSGTRPDPPSFDFRYVAYPWLAYGHIVPSIVFLVLAPFQLWRGFRNRHLKWHRRIGRLAIVSGVLSGIFAVVFGFFLSYGGALQAGAAVLFGTWFVAALSIAHRAIRRRDVRNHRRWMIRAFAAAIAVGTIRLWVGLLMEVGSLDLRDAMGVGFWLAFAMHVVAAELWLRWRPMPSGVAGASG